MKRTLITSEISDLPDELCPMLKGAKIYDSSCSKQARVYYIDKDNGYYLKSSPKGTLSTEAIMANYYNELGLGARVLSYLSYDRDWMLTERVVGEDCTHSTYLDDPRRLCDTIAELLRGLHETDWSDCPIKNRTAAYLGVAAENSRKGMFDTELFTEKWSFPSAKAAWDFLQANKHYLKNDTLLHGDYCLPNIILDNWRFSGFIDLGNGGVGDRHIDLFWGMWTLWFNLKTTAYSDRFFDAYGRDKTDPEILRIIAAAEVFG
ncbi:MAG: aminoglycoside 3'-phosphotransferase [Clostridia bacterium]|nr:aminoglycoside 3'-phosphotransferase [Clostridia bacterium]